MLKLKNHVYLTCRAVYVVSSSCLCLYFDWSEEATLVILSSFGGLYMPSYAANSFLGCRKQSRAHICLFDPYMYLIVSVKLQLFSL